jgi:hypothetical protein
MTYQYRISAGSVLIQTLGEEAGVSTSVECLFSITCRHMEEEEEENERRFSAGSQLATDTWMRRRRINIGPVLVLDIPPAWACAALWAVSSRRCFWIRAICIRCVAEV